MQREEVISECSEVLGLGGGLEGNSLVVEAHPLEQTARPCWEIVGAKVADLGAVYGATCIGVEEGLLSIDIDIKLVEP